MPYKDPAAARLASRERQRRYRERQRAAKARAPEAVLPVPAPADPVGELASWAASTLKVPPGHPLAGQPMALPDFAVDFLRAGWGAHESALCVARKNAKSAVCAVLALGHLVGPLRSHGWRGAIASVSKEKAAELRSQVAAIAEASGLSEVDIRRSPYPGKILSATGSLETLAAERTAGHSSSFDLVIVDETGLMPERSRELLAGLRSSVSAKAGRIIHISVRGDSPLFAEVLDNPATVSRIFAAPEAATIDDQAAWHAANPGIAAGIKQLGYMAHEVNRVRGAPADEPSFRAFDLNQNLDPTREMILSPDDLRACFVDDLPPRDGPAFLGFDFGEATSSTAAAAIWPATGRVETWMAFGDVPALIERQRRDSAPYVAMERRGELFGPTRGGSCALTPSWPIWRAIWRGSASRRRRRTPTRIQRSAISSTGRRCAGLSTFAASAPAGMAVGTSERSSGWCISASLRWPKTFRSRRRSRNRRCAGTRTEIRGSTGRTPGGASMF